MTISFERSEIAKPWHPHFGDIASSTVKGWLSPIPGHCQPERSLVLATTERSGSEWLCQLMGGTSKLGKPSEYFNTAWMHRFISDYPQDVASQVAIAHRVGTTENGVFSAKLHPWHFDRLSGRVSFASVFPDPQFIHLIRRDRLAQAISLYRARYTGQYHSFTSAQADPVYDAAAIADAITELETGEMRWSIFFAKNGISPLIVAYEDLLKSPSQMIRLIAKFAGVRLTWPLRLEKTKLSIQRDATTREWTSRFRSEFAGLDQLDLK